MFVEQNLHIMLLKSENKTYNQQVIGQFHSYLLPFLLGALIIINAPVHAQKLDKPVIDFEAIDDWPSLDSKASITIDGNYIAYKVNYHDYTKRTLYLKATKGTWNKKIDSIKRFEFATDGKHGILIDDQRHLSILRLGTNERREFTNIIDYSVFSSYQINWLMYNDDQQNYHIINLSTGKITTYPNVIRTKLIRNSELLFLITKTGDQQSVSMVDLKSMSLSTLCTTPNISNLVISPSGEKFAFRPSSNDGNIWYVNVNNPEKINKLNSSLAADTTLKIYNVDHFNTDGSQLYIKLQEKPLPALPSDAIMVDVWGFEDKKLQSQQLAELGVKSYDAVIDLPGEKVSRLQFEDQKTSYLNQHYAIITELKASSFERNWNASAKTKHYLFNLITKEKDSLPLWPNAISPDGKYLIGSETDRFNDLFAYNIQTKKTIKITVNLLPNSVITRDILIDNKRNFNFYGWLDDEVTALFYDEFDLWKVDLRHPERITNLTNGYGRKNNIIFRPIVEKSDSRKLTREDLSVLSAFNLTNKQNGFYKLDLSKNSDPSKLSMHDAYFYAQISILPSSFPVKSKNAKLWILRRMNYNDPGNFVLTSDFIKFQQISDIHPEKAYNWLTAELVNFKSLTGEKVQGILYKPENFDAKKKYPMLIKYYEQWADRLHTFPKPEYSADLSDIAYFVSHGYLFFTPDIPIVVGKQGESAYHTVVGAAIELSKLNYVDSTKMAIEGHSFGSFLTNYIVTRTDRFAAAVSASGPTDLISFAGDVMKSNGEPYGRASTEISQGRIGKHMWSGQNEYIENSAVFRLDKINTPLLLRYNPLDDVVPFSQGRELFTGLRRLEKRTWLLCYDGETHSISNKKNLIDYTTRMLGFLDHYLRGQSIPDWMRYGIPAKDKGYKKGY